MAGQASFLFVRKVQVSNRAPPGELKELGGGEAEGAEGPLRRQCYSSARLPHRRRRVAMHLAVSNHADTAGVAGA